jgi:hypothetical protein
MGYRFQKAERGAPEPPTERHSSARHQDEPIEA